MDPEILHQIILYTYDAGMFPVLKLVSKLFLQLVSSIQLPEVWVRGIWIQNGYTKLIQLIHPHNGTLDNWGQLCHKAAYYGHLDLVKWAKKQGYYCSREYYYYGAKRNNLDMIKWDIARGGPLYCLTDAQDEAARNGNIKLLKWIFLKTHLRSKYACYYAALNGKLRTLKWLRRFNFPWHEDICYYVTKFGYWKVLTWSILNGCPTDNERNKKAFVKHIKYHF